MNEMKRILKRHEKMEQRKEKAELKEAELKAKQPRTQVYEFIVTQEKDTAGSWRTYVHDQNRRYGYKYSLSYFGMKFGFHRYRAIRQAKKNLREELNPKKDTTIVKVRI